MSGRQWWGARLRTWAMSESPLKDAEDAETGRKILSADMWSFGIGAAVAGYFSADYLEFYSPTARAVFGLATLMAIVLAHRAVSTRLHWKRLALLLPIMVALLAVMVASGDYIASATNAAEAADIRCEHIQHEMLKPHPRRADLPDIFEALGCHASGREDIVLPS